VTGDHVYFTVCETPLYSSVYTELTMLPFWQLLFLQFGRPIVVEMSMSSFNYFIYSTQLYSTLLYSTLLYSALLYSTLLYSALLYSTLLSFLTLIFTVLHYPSHVLTVLDCITGEEEASREFQTSLPRPLHSSYSTRRCVCRALIFLNSYSLPFLWLFFWFCIDA
jgi:hypothetical protein